VSVFSCECNTSHTAQRSRKRRDDAHEPGPAELAALSYRERVRRTAAAELRPASRPPASPANR
jgi:hypothetical protein